MARRSRRTGRLDTRRDVSPDRAAAKSAPASATASAFVPLGRGDSRCAGQAIARHTSGLDRDGEPDLLGDRGPEVDVLHG